MKIGITQLCVPGTIAEVVAKVKAWDYEVIELGMKAEGGVLNLSTTSSEQKDIVKKITDAGLKLVSIVAGPVPEFPLNSRDAAVRAKGIERCKRVLDTASAMGASTILLVPGPVVSDTCYDEAVKYCIDSLRTLAPHAASAGVHIGVEPVWNKFLVSPLDMKHVLESVGSAYVGLYMDTGNMVFWNLPEHWIKMLGKYIKKVHFKDFKRDGMTLKFPQLRTGEVNWQAVMRELRAAKYDGPVISEVGGDDAMMAETAKVMREIIKL